MEEQAVAFVDVVHEGQQLFNSRFDVQSLLPFDVHGKIVESLKKTGRILFLDEDVPGGTSAYMMQEVLENQGGYFWLDSMPRSLTGAPHRPAYGSDGDYWSKPNIETIFDMVYEMMRDAAPNSFPAIMPPRRI